MDDVQVEQGPEHLHNGEPLFTVRERLEHREMVIVDEDNILSVAKAFGWVVGYTDKGEPALYDRDRADRPGWPKAKVGDRLSTGGSKIHDGGWMPRGSYRLKEGTL